MSITVFGSINLDLTAYVESLPRPGVTAHATSYTTGLGGKGANQAVAAQLLPSVDPRLEMKNGVPVRRPWSCVPMGPCLGRHYFQALNRSRE
jgi:hypothetical protein